jgi:hypothetical protein
MAGPVHKFDKDFVITNIGDLKNNHRQYTTIGEQSSETDDSSSLLGIVPFSRIIRGPSTIRQRESVYTPSKGGDPLKMGN